MGRNWQVAQAGHGAVPGCDAAEFELGAAGAELLVGGLPPGTAAVARRDALAPHWSGPKRYGDKGLVSRGQVQQDPSALRAVNALKVG